MQRNAAVHLFRREKHKNVEVATSAALEVIARGNEFVIPVPSKRITAEERLRLKRYNRKISQKSRVGFNMLVQSMGTNAVYKTL